MDSVVAIIQARMSSTRLAGKIMLPLPIDSTDSVVLSQVCRRAAQAVDNIIVATTVNSADDEIVTWARANNINIFRGSEDDVLDRYYKAALEYHANAVVRITSDCPCIDSSVISRAIDLFNSGEADYVSNTQVRTFPHGLDVEVFSFSALERAWREATEKSHREHVTTYLYRSGLFSCVNFIDSRNNADIRITVDTPEDYDVVCAIYDLLGDNFSYTDVVELFNRHKWLKRINADIIQKKVYHNLEEEVADAYELLMRSGMYEVAAGIKR